MEAIEDTEKPEDSEKPEEESEEYIPKKLEGLENLIIKKKNLTNNLIKETNAKYKDGNFEDANKLINETENQLKSIEILGRKMKGLYQSLGEESVEKAKNIAYFELKDFDKGLNYKEARDILKNLD